MEFVWLLLVVAVPVGLVLLPFIYLVSGFIHLRRRQNPTARWMGRWCLAAGGLWLGLGGWVRWKSGWKPGPWVLSLDGALFISISLAIGGPLFVGGFYLWRVADVRLRAEREAAEDRRSDREHRAAMRSDGIPPKS